MFEKVRTILLEYVDVEKEDITPETEFLMDLKMNSYDIVTMIGQLEEEFDITIEAEELEGIMSVGDLAKYLSENT